MSRSCSISWKLRRQLAAQFNQGGDNNVTLKPLIYDQASDVVQVHINNPLIQAYLAVVDLRNPGTRNQAWCQSEHQNIDLRLRPPRMTAPSPSTARPERRRERALHSGSGAAIWCAWGRLSRVKMPVFPVHSSPSTARTMLGSPRPPSANRAFPRTIITLSGADSTPWLMGWCRLPTSATASRGRRWGLVRIGRSFICWWWMAGSRTIQWASPARRWASFSNPLVHITECSVMRVGHRAST